MIIFKKLKYIDKDKLIQSWEKNSHLHLICTGLTIGGNDNDMKTFITQFIANDLKCRNKLDPYDHIIDHNYLKSIINQ